MLEYSPILLCGRNGLRIGYGCVGEYHPSNRALVGADDDCPNRSRVRDTAVMGSFPPHDVGHLHRVLGGFGGVHRLLATLASVVADQHLGVVADVDGWVRVFGYHLC